MSSDSDGDGILDHDDEDNESYQSENREYEIDSLYGNREATFNLKVYELGAFLNNLDPLNNFETPHRHSILLKIIMRMDFLEPHFLMIRYLLNFEEIRINFKEDDLETLDVDENDTS